MVDFGSVGLGESGGICADELFESRRSCRCRGGGPRSCTRSGDCRRIYTYRLGAARQRVQEMLEEDWFVNMGLPAIAPKFMTKQLLESNFAVPDGDSMVNRQRHRVRADASAEE